MHTSHNVMYRNISTASFKHLPKAAVYVEFGAHISATFISANTTRRRQSQRLFNSAPSNTALAHFGDLHFSEHNSPLSKTGSIEIVIMSLMILVLYTDWLLIPERICFKISHALLMYKTCTSQLLSYLSSTSNYIVEDQTWPPWRNELHIGFCHSSELEIRYV